MGTSMDYVTSLEELTWGIVLLAITMAMHGLAMVGTIRVIRRIKPRDPKRVNLEGGVAVLIVAAWLITFAHLLEVVVWAAFFVWKGAMPNASVAFYFSLLDYTTLGSEYSLPSQWRLLEGMIAIAGLMTFAWSTGVLFAVAQEFQTQQLALLERKSAKARRPVEAEPPAPR